MLDDFYTKRYIQHPDYHPPARFNHFEYHEVGKYDAGEQSDGHDTKILEMRCPSTFFTVIAFPNDNSNGFKVDFGSGDDLGLDAFRIAKLISDGMLGFHPVEDTKSER